jgi:ABC-type amino acid transport substrate-binding protein
MTLVVRFSFHQRKKGVLKQEVTIADLEISAHDIHRAVSDKSPLKLAKVNKYLNKFKASGKMKEIFKKYH